MYSPDSNGVTDKYLSVEPTTTSMQFDVRACKHARVRLSAPEDEDNGITQFYSLIIGADDGSKCRISKNNQIVSEKNCGNLLDCEITKSFWVTWDKSMVILGLGKVVGVHPLVSYTDVSNAPVYVRVIYLSTTLGNDAHWVVNKDAGIVKLISQL